VLYTKKPISLQKQDKD